MAMRVLQIHNRHRRRGGEDEVVEFEERLLADGGHVVRSLIVDNPTTWQASATTTLRAPWNTRAAAMALEVAREFAPDVVHVHNTWFALSPAVVDALARAGHPVVMTLHNFRTSCANGVLLRQGSPCQLCVGSHPWHAVWHRCYQGSAGLSAVAALTINEAHRRRTWQRQVRRFLAIDASALDVLIAGGIPAERIVVHQHSVVDPGPRPMAPSASQEIVFAGRLSPEKGPQVLLAAWRVAAPEHLRLTMYGDGPMRAQLEAAAVPGVRFAGWVDRAAVTGAMARARALVFPSTCREGGLAPVEAAAAGLPMVLSGAVGMSGQVESSGAGWRVPAGDVGALAAALSAAEDGAAVDRAGTAARRMYAEHHSADAALARLEAVYSDVLMPGQVNCQ